jgi:hypothetical protein
MQDLTKTAHSATAQVTGMQISIIQVVATEIVPTIEMLPAPIVIRPTIPLIPVSNAMIVTNPVINF